MAQQTLRIEDAVEPTEEGELLLIRAIVQQAVLDANSYATVVASRDATKWRQDWQAHNWELWDCLDAIVWLRDPADRDLSYRWCCEVLGHGYKRSSARLDALLEEVKRELAAKPPAELPSRPRKRKIVAKPLKEAA